MRITCSVNGAIDSTAYTKVQTIELTILPWIL